MLGGPVWCFYPFSHSLVGWKHLVMVLFFPKAFPGASLSAWYMRAYRLKQDWVCFCNLGGYLDQGVQGQKTLPSVGGCGGRGGLLLPSHQFYRIEMCRTETGPGTPPDNEG